MTAAPRPAVSVVMPFAGDAAAARAAVASLVALKTRPGDQLILADNSGTAPPADRVQHVRATGERSPAHARNAGAHHATTTDWILFLDADCIAPPDLLDAYFKLGLPAADVGAIAGEVAPETPGESLAERYAAARSFLSAQAHVAHPFQPRAAAANLLVRRAAFEQVGGFYEGLRAAEDTDLSWRLQAAGWRLELRAEALVSGGPATPRDRAARPPRAPVPVRNARSIGSSSSPSTRSSPPTSSPA
jgi:GT2 family glycosyltransferase